MATIDLDLQRYTILKTFGQGFEGTVHLVKNNTTGDQLVLKQFHQPIPFNKSQGLRFYAERVTPNQVGLATITLSIESEKIYGLQYPFVPLKPVHWRFVKRSPRLAQTLFAAFCRMQAYLISEHQLGLGRGAAPRNFLLTNDGRFYFIDYGTGIQSVHLEWALDHGVFAHGFATMIAGLFNIDFYQISRRSPGYVYDVPDAYSRNPLFDDLAARHSWLGKILDEVRSSKASILLDPDFYVRISESLPCQVPSPWLVTGATRLLTQVGRLRQPHAAKIALFAMVGSALSFID